MQEERLWLLVSLKFSNEASPEELEELNALLQEHPEAYFQMEVLEKLWKAKRPGEKNKDAHYDKHLQRLSNYLAEPALQYDVPGALIEPARIYPYKRLLWASSIAALFIISFVFLHSIIKKEKKLFAAAASNSISTRLGSKSKIQLPDGTQVWLNADSKITYKEDFSGDVREVHLSGEAYFDVVKDVSRPFIIHTQSVAIKVLGTAFNVRSYPNEALTETALIRGSVEVTVLNNGKKIMLQPNEKLVVKKEPENDAELQPAIVKEKTPELSVSRLHYLVDDSTSVETSWVKNKLAFEGETLEQVAGKIERWYAVDIQITDEALKQVEYTGVFEDESVQEVMNALQLTGNFRYAIDKKGITIRP